MEEQGVVAPPPDDALDDPVGDPPAGRAPGPRWARPGDWPLWWHAAALALALLALLPVVDNGSVGLPDEGLYMGQAARLADGSWFDQRVGLPLDPDGSRTAFITPTLAGRSEAPYTRHPLYPLLLTPAVKVGGVTGAILVSLSSTWLAAVCAGSIGRRLRRRTGPVALWLVGVGSPLLFDGYTVMGHAPAAALAGVLAVLLLRGLPGLSPGRTGDRPIVPWAVAGSLVAGGLLVGIRSEGLLVTVAVGIGLLALSVRRGGAHATQPSARWSVDLPRAVTGALFVLVAGAAYALDSWWSSLIGQGSGALSAPMDRGSDPLQLVWISMFRPTGPDPTDLRATMAVVLLGAVAGPLLLRMLPRRPLLGVGLLWAAAVAASVQAVQTPGRVTGLFAAFPALLVGLLSLRRADLGPASSQLLLLSSALAAGAIAATTYGTGGAAEWGGRFFHVLLPLLVPVAALGMDSARKLLPRPERGLAVAAVVALTTAMAVCSLRINVDLRQTAGKLVTATTAFAARPGGGSDPVLVATLTRAGESRYFWQQVVDGRVVLNPGGIADMAAVMRDSDRSTTSSLVLVTNLGPELVGRVLEAPFERFGWEITGSEQVRGTQYWLHRLQATPPPPPS